MKKAMTAEEQAELITTLANATRRYLERRECVQTDDGFETATATEIRDTVGIAPALWQAVQTRMIEMHIPLCLKCGRGFYLGNGTEQSATLIVPGAKGVRTRMATLGTRLVAAQAAGLLADILEYARDELGYDLRLLPESFRAWNLALPGIDETMLLE